MSKTYILNILFHKRIRDISAIKLRKLAFPLFKYKLFSRPHCSSHMSTVLNLGKKLKTMAQRPRAPLMVRYDYYISVSDFLRIIPLKVVKLKHKWHICVKDWILHKLSTHIIVLRKQIFSYFHMNVLRSMQQISDRMIMFGEVFCKFWVPTMLYHGYKNKFFYVFQLNYYCFLNQGNIKNMLKKENGPEVDVIT